MISKNQSALFVIAFVSSWQGHAFAAPPVDLNSRAATETTAYSGPPPSSNTVHQYPPGTALQKKSQLEASYYNKAGEAIQKAESQGDMVQKTSNRSFSDDGQTVGADYYVVNPQGETVVVSSSREGNGEVEKNIAVYSPGSQTSSNAVVIEVPHADVKAAVAYGNGQGINSENAEAAKDVAVERGNVVQTTETREQVTP